MPVPLLPGGFGYGRAVDLGVLQFNQEPDSNGVEWWLEDLSGWDSPQLREDLDDRPLAHGAHRGTSYYGARELTLSGHLVSAYGAAARDAAVEELVFVTDLTDVDALLVVHELPGKQVSVRRSGRPRLEVLSPFAARFEVDLTAADPRKYAVAEQTLNLSPGSSAAPIVNAGNFRTGTPLRARFVGPLSSPVLFLPTGPIGLSSVAVGEQIIVDTLEGLVTTGAGATAYSRLTTSGMPHLPARTAGTALLIGSGAGHVELTWRDAWL